MMVLFVLPWLVIAYLYTRIGQAAGTVPPSSDSAVATEVSSGPWGQLAVTPVVISPPLEYVSTQLAVPRQTLWTFPGTRVEEIEPFLAAAGLSTEDVASLHKTLAVDPAIHGLTLRPSEDLLRRLDPQVRSRLYSQLARTGLNPTQAQAFRYEAKSTDEWLGNARISAETRHLIDPFVYRYGSFLYFADFRLIEPQIADQEEARRLAKALLRKPTLMVRVSVQKRGDAVALADYWGRGGRRTDVRPLLESLEGRQGEAIDIIHLLPAFVRNHLYRYPRISTADLERPILANCLWSSLNFFNATPDDRYLDVEYALDRLKHDYYVVETGFQLGDVIAFMNNDNIFHVAVYLADNLVFTKNGMTPMAPWTIATIDSVKGYYRTITDKPTLIVHRRNDQ